MQYTEPTDSRQDIANNNIDDLIVSFKRQQWE